MAITCLGEALQLLRALFYQKALVVKRGHILPAFAELVAQPLRPLH